VNELPIRNPPITQHQPSDPIVIALRLALAEIAARRAAESVRARGKMIPTARRKDTAA
jgi:hypothetical protein